MIIGKYNCHIAYSGIIFHAKSLPMDYCPDFRRRITTKRETILLARCFVGWLFRWLVVLLIVKLQAVSTNNETTLLRYCLPDSSPIYVYNPETSSRVTLASLGTVFQTDHIPTSPPHPPLCQRLLPLDASSHPTEKIVLFFHFCLKAKYRLYNTLIINKMQKHSYYNAKA